MFITDTQECKDPILAVYWFGDEKQPRQVGVCFEGSFFNIARQSLAESLVLANDVLTDMIDDIEPPAAEDVPKPDETREAYDYSDPYDV
jgi:hypothetical protein